MTEQLVIDRIGHRGEGVAMTNTGPVYVPFTLPGETVDVLPAEGERRVLSAIIAPSAERVAPLSPHYGLCGGCSLQHWASAPYFVWKRRLVVDALAQANIDTRINDTIDAHGEGRRRVTFHARRGEVGFMAAHSHTLVPIATCPVLAPSLSGALPAAKAIAVLLAAGKPLDIQVTATDDGLDIDVRGSGPLNARERTALARLAGEHKLSRLTRHGEMIAQGAVPHLTIGRARVALPPASFLQPTLAGEEVLSNLVLGHLGKAKRVADLFAGIGTFAFRLASSVRVLASDTDAAAMQALARAAANTQGLKPVEALTRDLFRNPFVSRELDGCDAVVFDPPRQGAEAQAREIAKSKVKRLIAVSCNVATFVRDARILINGGYRLVEVTPVDQFRWSAHVELVALFTR